MLKAYLSVIHASLILADMCRYHTQLSMVASYIDMISVIFIRGKSLKLHAPMSIHAMSILSPLNRNPDCPQSLLHRVPGKENHFNFDSHLIPDQFTDFILMASSSSELAFKNLSESVWTSLQMFNALHAIPSSGVTSSPLCLALNELVDAAVCKSLKSLSRNQFIDCL